MKTESAQSFIALAVAFLLALNPGSGLMKSGLAATSAIGTIAAHGVFRLDHASVTGNAVLFQGETVETISTGSSIQISGGARISLAADSKATVFGDRLILERGEGEFASADGFRMEALGLGLEPETGKSSARIALTGAGPLRAVALTGSFRVLNANGVLVAKLIPGQALSLQPQAGPTTSTITGVLHKVGQHYLLTDETTHVVVEVVGPGLAKQVGKRVQVIGSTDANVTPAGGATSVVHAASVNPAGTGAAGTGAAPAGSGGANGSTGTSGAAGAGGGAGASTGATLSATTIAIIGGVAAAGLVGGLAAAGDLSSKSSTADLSR